MTLLHREQIKHAFLVKTKEKSKPQKKIPKKKVFLELLHQRLGHRSTRSLLAGDTTNIWQYIQHRVDTDPFCTSCQISTINKKARSKQSLKSETSFKWLFMETIPATPSKILTKDDTFTNYILIVDFYSNIPKLYEMVNINTEEVMDKIDMFQEIFGKVDEFGWWYIERIQTDSGT